MCFLINFFYISTLILLQGHQSEAKGPVCLQCDQVAQPSNCKSVKQCRDQELCIMRKYVTNDGHVWFEVGCSSSQRCSPITSVVGKRNDDDGALSISSPKLGQNAGHNVISNHARSAGDTIICEKCCSGDICNAGSLCGTVGFLHEMVCFNCASTYEDGCSTVAFCDQNQKCFIEKVGNSSTSNTVWKTGCRHKDFCQQIQSSPGTECLSSCCSSDLCNRKCTNNNTDATCVDTSQTCKNKTFQSFVCSTEELRAVCQRSCGLCHCDPNPCTHGTCISSLQGYRCTCNVGYTGSVCDKVIDHCSPNPCVHGICNNSLQGHSCGCFSDYVGSTCTEISPCMSGPCIHGTCHTSPNGYYCTCAVGFMGSTCELPSDWIWTDCSQNQQLLTVDKAFISPYPPKIPGNVTVFGRLILKRNMSSNIELQFNVQRKGLLDTFLHIPCYLFNPDRCTYDFCLLMSRFNGKRHLSCPPQMIKQNIPCSCPLLAGTYTLNPYIWEIPKLSSLLNRIFPGEIKIHFKLIDKDTNEMIGCYNVEMELGKRCTGLFCGIG